MAPDRAAFQTFGPEAVDLLARVRNLRRNVELAARPGGARPPAPGAQVERQALIKRNEELDRQVARLTQILQETENRTVDQLTAEDLRYFLDSRRSRRPRGGPIRASTRQEYVRVLKPFFGWLHTEGYIDTNPMQGIS